MWDRVESRGVSGCRFKLWLMIDSSTNCFCIDFCCDLVWLFLFIILVLSHCAIMLN